MEKSEIRNTVQSWVFFDAAIKKAKHEKKDIDELENKAKAIKRKILSNKDCLIYFNNYINFKSIEKNL
jgi:hypothetical protein